MYSWRQMKRGIRNPSLVKRKIRKGYLPQAEKWLNTRRGIDFLEQDWDNLILLDACRSDLFRAENAIDGTLSSARSNASSSDEFFEKNIAGKSHGDLVYYSANPHIDNVEASFHEVFRLWDNRAWNKEIGTVLPEDAADFVIETSEQYDDKRVIVHMMQPHRPFLGDLAKDFEQSGFSRAGVNRRSDEPIEIPFWWNRLEEGTISRKRVKKMYRETLRVALPHVQRIINHLPGKTVVSADHGNLFGERGKYGHPSYVHHRNLNTVPWLEIDKKRKEIVEEPATVQSKQEHFDSATDQLEALGYVD